MVKFNKRANKLIIDPGRGNTSAFFVPLFELLGGYSYAFNG